MSHSYPFLPAHLDHHHLHSFPTRRFSDLSTTSTSASPSACTASPWASPTPAPSASPPTPPTPTWWTPPTSPSWTASRSPRSEEHTSELRSRPHLVCRLLLEKKKKTTNKF